MYVKLLSIQLFRADVEIGVSQWVKNTDFLGVKGGIDERPEGISERGLDKTA